MRTWLCMGDNFINNKTAKLKVQNLAQTTFSFRAPHWAENSSWPETNALAYRAKLTFAFNSTTTCPWTQNCLPCKRRSAPSRTTRRRRCCSWLRSRESTCPWIRRAAPSSLWWRRSRWRRIPRCSCMTCPSSPCVKVKRLFFASSLTHYQR